MHTQTNAIPIAAKKPENIAQKKSASKAKALPPVPVFQMIEETKADKLSKEKNINKHLSQTFNPLPKKENNTGLPNNLKAGIENLSGFSMDDVKVHYNSDKPAQLNAHAYTQGTDIHIAPSQEKHLPHEAWHVVQQKQGRVKATMQMKGVAVNDDKGLEQEADVMGKNVVMSQSLDFSLKNKQSTKQAANFIVQGRFKFMDKEYEEEKLSRDELLVLWRQVKEQNAGADHSHIMQRLSYTFFARFGKPIAAALNEAEPGQPQQQPPFSPSIPGTAHEKEEVIAVLTNWLQYVERAETALKPLMNELIETRSKIGDEFYEQGNAEFKKLFKKLHEDINHLNAAKWTCGQIRESITSEPEHVRVFRRNGKIEAVMKNTGSSSGIDDIAADPRNIVPDFDQTSVVKGIARATITLAILETRKQSQGRGQNIGLIAHNNKTKRVYNALGFKIGGQQMPGEQPGGEHRSKLMLDYFATQKEKQYMALPEEKQEAAEGLALEKEIEALRAKIDEYRDRTPWHKEKSMSLLVQDQQQFVEKGKGLLNVPDALQQYINPQ